MELSLIHQLKFSYPYIFATWGLYSKFNATLGSKHIGISKSKFVAKNQLLL